MCYSSWLSAGYEGAFSILTVNIWQQRTHAGWSQRWGCGFARDLLQQLAMVLYLLGMRVHGCSQHTDCEHRASREPRCIKLHHKSPLLL